MTDQITPDQGVTNEPEIKESYLSQLVGEGKKYVDNEALAKSRVDADAHIAKVEAEAADIREKLEKKDNQDAHLETIVSLLQPQEVPKVVEAPIVEKIVDPVVAEPVTPVIDDVTKQKAEEFAKLSVDKYGDFKVAESKVKEYIADDPSRQEMVAAMLRSDPSALIKILPDHVVPKEGSITSGTSMTAQTNISLPLTNTEAMKVRKEDPVRYKSPEYQAKIKDAWLTADAAGMKFTDT